MPPNNSRHFFNLLYTIVFTINPTKTTNPRPAMTTNPVAQDMHLAHGPSTGTDSMAKIDLAMSLIFYLQSKIHFVYNHLITVASLVTGYAVTATCQEGRLQ